MNVIKNEKGTFIELPRESITFCGNTEEEKKANELIFDLSLENDGLQQELERYKNIIKNIKEEIELYIDITIDHFETSNEEINFELRNKCRAMREIKSEILEIIEKELKGSDE